MLNFLKKKGSEIMERKEAILKYGIPFFAILLLINTIQIARFGRIVEGVDRYKEGLVDELGGFRQDIKNFGGDINEMRNNLLLPTKDYSFLEQEVTVESDNLVKASDTEQALYEYIGALVYKQKMEKNTQKALTDMQSLQKNEELRITLEDLGLVMGMLKQDEQSISFEIWSATEKLFEVLTDLKTGNIRISDTIGEANTLEGVSEDQLKQEVIYYIWKNKEVIESTMVSIEDNKSLIEGVMKDDEISKLLGEKKLHASEEAQEGEGGISYHILNGDEITLMTIFIKRKDASIHMNGKAITQDDDLKALLISAISQMDGSTIMDKIVQERRAELEGIIREEAFIELLNTVGFKIAPEPRGDYNKLLYDITDSDGNLQFSFVIELSSGHVKVLKDNQEIDLFSALLENSKKKL